MLDKADYVRPTGFDPESGILYLNFKPARSIEPGKPYVFEWRTSVASQIDNPVFENVTIKTSEPTEMTVTSTDNTVQFVGTYAPVPLISMSTANLYMGTDDFITYPMEPNQHVYSFAAYFLVDLGNGIGVPGEANVNRIVMNIDDDEDLPTKVIDIVLPTPVQDDAWYDLQGRRYTSQPTHSGIFIQNGRKILIK